MTIYWLLFAFPALMAMSYGLHIERTWQSQGQRVAMLAFVTIYALIGMLRYEIGGDWITYDEIFEEIARESLGYAIERTDPLYGMANWLSAQLGTGIYPVNGLCCWILGLGTIKAATRLREPWLAILIAVPYLLIVVGMGYVRQGAAIGMVLMALAALDQGRTGKTVLFLALAVGFHSTAIVVFIAFAWTLVSRNKGLAVIGAVIGAAAFFFILSPRLDRMEAGYLDADYESGGAMVRVLMGLIPAFLVMIRWKSFLPGERVRSVWLLLALGNFVAMGALLAGIPSTAVDRLALFLAVIQLAAFGEIRDLLGISNRMVLFTRLVLVGVAGAVQMVWLVFGTHASLWVPYQSLIEQL